MPAITISEPEAYKVGSTWSFSLVRKQPNGEPVDLTGLIVRAMFRAVSVDGAVVVTLVEGGGIEVTDETGHVALTIDAEISASIATGIWVYFDVEMTNPATGHVWQSNTYRFRTEQQVTR